MGRVCVWGGDLGMLVRSHQFSNQTYRQTGGDVCSVDRDQKRTALVEGVGKTGVELKGQSGMQLVRHPSMRLSNHYPRLNNEWKCGGAV